VHFFKNETTLGHILPKISAILLEFSTNKSFWGCAWTPASYATWCT